VSYDITEGKFTTSLDKKGYSASLSVYLFTAVKKSPYHIIRGVQLFLKSATLSIVGWAAGYTSKNYNKW
jgi:hypothetical protein